MPCGFDKSPNGSWLASPIFNIRKTTHYVIPTLPQHELPTELQDSVIMSICRYPILLCIGGKSAGKKTRGRLCRLARMEPSHQMRLHCFDLRTCNCTPISRLFGRLYSLTTWRRSTQSIKGLSIKIDRSDSSSKTILHAINALRTRIKLGIALKAGRMDSPHCLQLHLVSIECCLFASAWMKEVSTRPEAEWTVDEKECVRLVGQTLGEIELDRVNAHKPYSTQLVYAWALIFDCCAVWGIQLILTDALKRFADSLS
ncbi:hypothetical protein DL98DRAFT_241303 [Cadophora sp. DSE1049]|nr:hypothetical protein DL98DRAFT_241303 [Cadophora sp. DSE1049]